MNQFVVGQRVKLHNMRKALLMIDGKVIFDYHNARGNTGVIVEIDNRQHVKLVVALDEPNIGKLRIAPRYVAPFEPATALAAKESNRNVRKIQHQQQQRRGTGQHRGRER